jgi:hypothetical protein
MQTTSPGVIVVTWSDGMFIMKFEANNNNNGNNNTNNDLQDLSHSKRREELLYRIFLFDLKKFIVLNEQEIQWFGKLCSRA